MNSHQLVLIKDTSKKTKRLDVNIERRTWLWKLKLWLEQFALLLVKHA